MRQYRFITFLVILSSLCLAVFAGTTLAQNVEIRGNSVQLGNAVLVPEGTVNHGDAVAIFNDVTVLGEVRGDVVSVGGSVRVEGKVQGNVVGVGGQVSLGDNAEVNGDVTAVGAGLQRAPGAKIMGSINNIGIGEFLRNPRINLSNWHWNWGVPQLIGYLFYLAGLYALALITISFFSRNVAGVIETMEKDWGRSALVGVLTLLLIGPATLLIAVTIIGIPLAFLLWVGFFLAKMLGYVAAVSMLGLKVAGGNKEMNSLAQLSLGVLILGLIRYVPFIGALVSLAVTIVTIGAVMDSKFGTMRPWLPPRRNA